MTAFLKYKNLPVVLLAAILISAGFFMFNAAEGDSAIMDELAHIPAGFSYVKFLDFRLNPEHPPLLKVLSALPLLNLDLKFPKNHKSWTEDINGQWEAGDQFLYQLGNDADQIIGRARILPIILTLITALLIYVWSKELLGKWWALLPTFLFGFSPTVLAHGHYVTTDIAATFGTIFAAFMFVKFLLCPSRTHLILAGLGLGVAQLLKFSMALLIPYFLILTLVFAFTRFQNKSLWYYLRSLLFICLIALLIIYLVYLIFTLNYPQAKQISDTTAILASFDPYPIAAMVIKMAYNPILRPLAHYLSGFLMVLQRAAGGNTVYFLGEVSAAGSKIYFPLMFLMKESLPALLLIFSALMLGVWNILKIVFRKSNQMLSAIKNYLGTNFAEFAMLLFIIIYVANSVNSALNIGVRHLLPTFPFIYILTVGGIKLLKKRFVYGLVIILALWQFGETTVASPHFLSYFNEAAGGSSGYRYVTDSNYDWGQDLKRLKNFTVQHNIQKIAVDYFGGGNPKYYLGEIEEDWRSAKGNPKDFGIEWLAISVNTLEGAFAKLHPGQQRNPADEYRWLEEKRPRPNNLGAVPEPDFRIGKSIFVYHL